MKLFVVRHQHEAARCPARNPEMGVMLLQHLSAANAEKHGIRIHGEGVLDGQHTLFLILEAEDDAAVRQYMAPFAQAGTVDVWPASPCETVVTRREC
ncbi:MAG: sulfite oxidase [Acidobacteria bacterium]|nr:sulfite oxidase [Acidobacteriota bacterium]MDW7984072.1 DUF3303 family protein [Acidobacteriota bacterium]